MEFKNYLWFQMISVIFPEKKILFRYENNSRFEQNVQYIGEKGP